MTVALLTGLACGAGVWLAITALKPASVPLAEALADVGLDMRSYPLRLPPFDYEEDG